MGTVLLGVENVCIVLMVLYHTVNVKHNLWCVVSSKMTDSSSSLQTMKLESYSVIVHFFDLKMQIKVPCFLTDDCIRLNVEQECT